MLALSTFTFTQSHRAGAIKTESGDPPPGGHGSGAEPQTGWRVAWAASAANISCIPVVIMS